MAHATMQCPNLCPSPLHEFRLPETSCKTAPNVSSGHPLLGPHQPSPTYLKRTSTASHTVEHAHLLSDERGKHSWHVHPVLLHLHLSIWHMLRVLCRAKQLWDLVHDDDMIARERETAAKNRNKYSGYDRDTAAFAGRSSLSGTSSRPSTPTADAFTTTPKTKTADTPPDTPAAADAVAATEARISKLAVADDSPDGADGAAAGAALPPRARQKKKLSQMSVCCALLPVLCRRNTSCSCARSARAVLCVLCKENNTKLHHWIVMVDSIGCCRCCEASCGVSGIACQ